MIRNETLRQLPTTRPADRSGVDAQTSPADGLPVPYNKDTHRVARFVGATALLSTMAATDGMAVKTIAYPWIAQHVENIIHSVTAPVPSTGIGEKPVFKIVKAIPTLTTKEMQIVRTSGEKPGDLKPVTIQVPVEGPQEKYSDTPHVTSHIKGEVTYGRPAQIPGEKTSNPRGLNLHNTRFPMAAGTNGSHS